MNGSRSYRAFWRSLGAAGITLSFAAAVAADPLCDAGFSTAEGNWVSRWGNWTNALAEPPYHVACPANGQSAVLSTNLLNAAVLEYALPTPGTAPRRADVSFMMPLTKHWSHIAVFPAYDPATIGRIGADVFHDPNDVDPDRIVIQFNQLADADCEGSNLHGWVPIPGNLQLNHWYRLSVQMAQRADGGLDVLGVVQDLAKEDRPIMVGTLYSAPAACTPTWYATEARWAVGTLGMTTGIETYLDDFSGAPTPVPLAFQESGGLVVMEAEHPDGLKSRNGKSWNLKIAQTSFSGNSYFEAAPNSGSVQNSGYVTASPELFYRVKFTTPGTYYIWIRGAGPTTADDTVHAGLDGAGPSTADKITGFPATWTWSRSTMDGSSQPARITVASAGIHTVHLWMREDGFRVDKILLRLDSASTPPAGTGPAESPRAP